MGDLQGNQEAQQNDVNRNSQMEVSTNHAAPSPILFQIARMKFRDQLVKIFSDSLLEKNPRQFFFEPLVLLDPKTIVIKHHSLGSFKQDFIQITIQMWNEELRSKVLERLRSMKTLNNVEIEEEDVCVLPFKEAQLVLKSGSIPPSIRLTGKPTSYLRSNENLEFYLLCNEPYSADVVAHEFRRNPEFTLNDWQIELDCRGLSIDFGINLPTELTSLKHFSFSFNISIHPKAIEGNLSLQNMVFLLVI